MLPEQLDKTTAAINGLRIASKKFELDQNLNLISKALLNGAGDRNRTCDPLITNQMLYLLSYTGVSV